MGKSRKNSVLNQSKRNLCSVPLFAMLAWWGPAKPVILVGERVSAGSRHSSQQPSEPSRFCRVMYIVDDTLAFWIVLAGVAKYSQVLDSIAVYSIV